MNDDLSQPNPLPQVETYATYGVGEPPLAPAHGTADVSELLKDKARLDWLEQGTSDKINSPSDFVDWTSGRITRAKIDDAMIEKETAKL